MPVDAATWIALVQLAVSVVGISITVWLALIVKRSTTRIAQLEFNRALRDSWMHVDQMTLQDPNLVGLMDQYLPPHKTADPGFGRKRLFLLVFLNPMYTTYQAAQQGLSSGSAAEVTALLVIDRVLTAAPPAFSEAEAAGVARDLFAVDGVAKVTESERDQTFLIDGDRPAVLKISNAAEDPIRLDLEAQAAQRIAAGRPGCPGCPAVAGARHNRLPRTNSARLGHPLGADVRPAAGPLRRARRDAD